MVWLLSLWLALQGGDPVGGGSPRLDGCVRASDAAPVAGATVTVSQAETDRVRVAVTDAHGRFTVLAFELSGAVIVTLEHPEYLTRVTGLSVDATDPAPLRLRVGPRRERR